MQSKLAKKPSPLKNQTVAKEGPRKALGRGLAALMPGASSVPQSQLPGVQTAGLRMLPIERLKPHPKQPRKHFAAEGIAELADSIKLQGVLQPIIVRREGDDYQIVAGERRWRAATAAGLQEVPTIVKELSDTQTLQIALIENIQRRDLDPIEEADAYRRLITEHALTHDELAEAVGKNRVTITNSLRLLKLPEEVLDMLSAGKLTAGHARALLALSNPKQVLRVAEDLVGRRASVRDAEIKVKQILQASKNLKPVAANDEKTVKRSAGVVDIEERLQRALGSKVRVVHNKGRGHIEIDFHSLDALEDLLDKLMGHG